MKYIVIVPDGMADDAIEELGGKTPLEAAHTKNMDFLAQHGQTGLVQTIPEGMKPGSDVGNMALLGYDPKTCLTGRAPLEAANLNIKLADDEIAFRCNLVTVADGKMSDYSAGHIRSEEAKILIDALNKELGAQGVRFYAGKSYRHLLVLKVNDPQKYMEMSTIPPHDISGKEIKPYLPQGEESKTILALMEKSKKILENHPINLVRVDLKENPATMIWLWGQGVRPQLMPFKQKFSLKGGIISAVDLVNGIGRLVGLEIIDVPGITGYYDTNFQGKADYALEALKSKDFVYIHIEAPDEAGHNGDYKAKVQAIENIDRYIVGTILNHFEQQTDVRILVLPDHPTPVKLRTHTKDPVGFVMCGKGIVHNGSKEYSEKAAKEQGLKFNSGEELIRFFLSS